MSVSEAQARQIAQDRLVSDGVVAFPSVGLSRDEVVTDAGTNWEVTYPLANPEVIGGEPHIVIDKSGAPDQSAIVDVFYTQ